MTTPTTHTDQPSRAFATAARRGGAVAYDPLTGLTHHAGDTPPGRVRLDPATVAAWPVVHPSDVQDRAPISVCWSPLVRCNLTCPFCLDDKSVPERSRADRTRIAHVLADSSVLGVDISGGEPLLLRELPDLIDILIAGGCAVSVTTNGTHLARRAEALAARVDAVRVSLDGPDDEQHDRWRGTGSFSGAVAGIRAAVAHGIPLQIQTVLLRSTAHTTAGPMIDLAAQLGASGVTFLQMLPIGDGADLADTEQLSDEEARQLLAGLDHHPRVPTRLRTRDAAGGFTVIRADSQVWHNDLGARRISARGPLREVDDLALTARDGAA